MPLAPSTNLLFAGVKRRWDERSVGTQLTGGIHEGEAPERTARPYAVIDGVSDVPGTWTNLGRYDTVVFQITVVADYFEQGGDLMGYVLAALEFASLSLDGAALVECRPGVCRFFRERQVRKTVQEFRAVVARPVDYHPA